MSTAMPTPTPEYLAEEVGTQLIATASLFIIFSTIFVVLRYYARYLTHTKLGLEDIITPFAWISQIGLCITAILMVKKAGAGRHVDYVVADDPRKLPEFFKGILVNEILHLPAVAFPKLCVLVLYLRVFTNKSVRVATWALIYIVASTWVAYTVAAAFQCQPFAFNWDKTIPQGKCFDVTVFALSSSVPNIVSDVAILFLPVRTIIDLKVSMGKRVGLCFIFLTGSVGIVASIIRTVVFARNNANIMAMSDITYTYTSLVQWTIIEPGLYLMAACALSFKPLFRMVAKALHLDSILTHTSSLTGRKHTRSGKTGTTISIAMETFKSSHAGFTKLDDSEVEVRKEERDSAKNGFSITVTHTVDMGVARKSEDEGRLVRGGVDIKGSPE